MAYLVNFVNCHKIKTPEYMHASCSNRFINTILSNYFLSKKVHGTENEDDAHHVALAFHQPGRKSQKNY